MIEVEILRTVQKKLSRYIFAKGFISWNGIKKACEKIILALPENEREVFQDKMYPEFEIFIPLLKNGSAEVCRSNERSTLLFCMNPNTNLILNNKSFIANNGCLLNFQNLNTFLILFLYLYITNQKSGHQ